MPNWFKYLLMVALLLAASLYMAAGAGLYVTQRDLIFQPQPNVSDAPPAGSIYRPLVVETLSGGKLTAWAARAANANAPTVFFFHGNASYVADFAELGAAFHRRGWNVILATYRGYAANPGEPSEDGLFEDGRAILAAAVSAGPVVLWGHSLGSGVAAKLASEGRAQALILESPFTSLADVGAELYPLFPVGLLLTERFDTASRVTDIRIPVLIFHSRDDRIVPFAHGARLAELFGDRATLIALEGSGHYPHEADLSATAVDWLNGTALGN